MIKITIKVDNKIVTKEIQVTKTLSGDFVLKEHPEIDIIVMPSKGKIVALPKANYTDYTNRIQNKFFTYMQDKGVVTVGSVKGSNIFGGLEGLFPVQLAEGNENIDPLQVAIYTISNFVDGEKPQEMYSREYEKAVHDEITNPSPKDSTELGEVPQEPVKGSIPKQGFPLKAIYRYTY